MSAVLETCNSGLLFTLSKWCSLFPSTLCYEGKNSQKSSQWSTAPKSTPFKHHFWMLKQGLKALLVQIPGYSHHKANYKYMYACGGEEKGLQGALQKVTFA